MPQTAIDPYIDDPIVIPGWSFGDRLRKARVMRGMDQRTLARILEVSPGAIGQWETDVTRPRDIAEVARKVQEACRVPAWWLLDIEPSMWSPLQTTSQQPAAAAGSNRRHRGVNQLLYQLS